MAVIAPPLPTLYNYYTAGGISSGLNTDNSYFTLNNRNITIYSGALHYFRVPKQYWRDRLQKMRAAGLNTVETYVPWNLHEPTNGTYDFGNGGSDMEDFLDINNFLEIAQEEDLLALIRPGPFICSEWEFGGFPSWLLREPNIKLRTSDWKFMKYVTRYFNMLLPILSYLQFTRGGPIIGFQVENEYGSTEQVGKFVPDRVYLRQLRDLFIKHRIVELLYTSDSQTGHKDHGTLPGIFLQTSNFASDPEKEFEALKQLQGNKPIMAMEFWSGWFDHWSEQHHRRDDNDFYNIYERILKYPASVNLYMFHGGTSFGFLNGANLNNDKTDNSGFQPDTTSYDYDAPLSESGDYTLKYVMVKELITKYNRILTRIPIAPSITPKFSFPTIEIESQLTLDELIEQVPNKIFSSQILPMEFLPINNNSGQSYGYIIYRMTDINIPPNSILKISGHIRDTIIVLVDGILMSKPLTKSDDLNKFGFWRLNVSEIIIGGNKNLEHSTLDLIVENWGRNNFGYLEQFNQFKGLYDVTISLNDIEIEGVWQIIPLEFKKNWNIGISGWHKPYNRWMSGPSLYKTILHVENVNVDTFVQLDDWVKGIVIVNGFVLGRYAKIGPQQTLYLPGPLLRKGNNTILIFDHYRQGQSIKFTTKPFYKTRI